ncbi:hypothetical protein, partial [uncultured Arcobacter sp.]|uniref:hypothetical protein n=1 Tax=uncultured Arcobacter sp. TaxID=165434 RepID=UPI00261053E8
MTVRFFRFEVKGTNETKLNAIKDWLVSKITQSDLSDNIAKNSSIGVYEEEEGSGNFTLQGDLYLKESVPMAKYKDYIVTEWQTLNKTGLDSARVIQYDNCSHDSDNPQPCDPTVRM